MKPPFATERDLCADFLAGLPEGWTAYAETAGWDILLVRQRDGFQVGIQAKLRLNVAVLRQALEPRYGAEHAGPDCRAVLVPSGSSDYAPICDYIGVVVLSPEGSPRGRLRYGPPLPGESEWAADRWHEWAPMRRCELPEYVPDVAAGAKSPLQLTPWKIGALKIAVLLEHRGFVTRADFRCAGIDFRRWVSRDTGWLVARGSQLVPGPHLPDFKRQHPVNFEQIKADMQKWAKPRGEAQGVLV